MTAIAKSESIYQNEPEPSGTQILNSIKIGFVTGMLLYLTLGSSAADYRKIDALFDQMDQWVKQREINRLTGEEPAGKVLSLEVVN
jgi:hypothetical protein